MAQDTTTKQFLDYNGLSTLWNNIKTKFVTKGEAIKSITAGHDETDTTGNRFYITYQKADLSTPVPLTIPVANTSNSGLMSPTHFDLIEDLRTNVGNTAPFAALQLGGTDIKLTNRKGNIKLEYINESNKTYIALKDATTGGTAVTKLDVTHLVKHGFLKDADVIINPQDKDPGTYLVLNFSTGSAGTGNDPVYINVSDLVEIYKAGDGIDITYETGKGPEDTAGEGNYSSTVGTISVKAATDSAFGGIKTGYTTSGKNYAVKLDSGNAYVAVPWTNTITNITKSTATDAAIEVIGGHVSDGTKIYTLDLTAAAKSSLNAADNALREITIGSKALNKSKTTYTVAEAKVDLGLGTASNSNCVTEITGTDDNIKSIVKTMVEGQQQNVQQPTIPTTEAVINYVSKSTSDSITGLTSAITAGTTTNSWPASAPASDKTAQAVWKKIVITNGVLDAAKSEAHNLVIADITDFRPLTAAEINEICVLS